MKSTSLTAQEQEAFLAQVRVLASPEQAREFVENPQLREGSMGERAHARWRLFLSACPVWDEALLRTVCRREVELECLFRNPHLPEPLLPVMLDEAMRRRREVEEQGSSVRANRLEFLLKELGRRGLLPPGSAERTEILWDLLQPDATQSAQSVMSAPLLRVLLSLPDLEEREFDQMVRDLPDPPRQLPSMATHPLASVEHLRLLLGRDWSEDMLTAIAGNPLIWQDEMLKSTALTLGYLRSPLVLEAMARSAPGEEFRPLFLALVERTHRGGARLLESLTPPQREALRAEDFLPLLNSPEAEVRLVAIRHSSGVTSPALPPPPAQGQGAR